MSCNVSVSVIVPVFNAEKTLEKCINSILNQSLQEIEVIAINDGSKDNSLQILHYLRKNDHRIKIIDQDNQGVSASRNNGIRIANGEYVTFVDSDDWIEPNMLENLYLVAKEKNADICKCDCFIEDINGHKVLDYESTKVRELSQVETLRVLFKERGEKHFGYACGKLYSKKFLIENNIFFNKEISYSEDVLFVVEAIINSNNIFYIPEQLYHYNLLTDNSLTRGKITDLNSKLDFIYKKIENLLKESNIFESIREDFYYYQYFGLGIIISNLKYEKLKINKIKKEISKYIKKYPDILNVELKSVNKKAKLINFLLRKQKLKLLAYLILFNNIRYRL